MASECSGYSLSGSNSDNSGISFGMSSFNQNDREAWGQGEARNGSASDRANAESEKAMQQYNARYLSWRAASNGNTEIRLCLPVEQAQGFLSV
jgi:hypothetical protein